MKGSRGGNKGEGRTNHKKKKAKERRRGRNRAGTMKNVAREEENGVEGQKKVLDKYKRRQREGRTKQ